MLGKSTPNLDAFIKEIKYHLKDEGVNCCLRKVRRCKEGLSGYFQLDPIPELFVAMKAPHWQAILVHEYCHFLQYIENEDVFNQYNKSKDVLLLDSHLNEQKRMDNALKYKAVKLTVDMELSCENRVIKLIRAHKLEIDIKEYIKNGNAYLYWHYCLLHKDKWTNKDVRKGYTSKVLGHMPIKYNKDPGKYLDPSPKHMALIEKHYLT